MSSKKFFSALVFVGLAITMMAACKSSVGPEPPVPDNQFAITDIVNYEGNEMGDYVAIISYQNHDDKDASVSGAIDFGDGVARDLFDGIAVLPAKSTNTSYPTFRCASATHNYASPGTYKVTFNLTANFARGPISSSFSKDMVIT